MARFLLDTGVLVGWVRDAPFARYVNKKYQPEVPPSFAAISVVSKGEIQSLAYRLGWTGQKRQKLTEILNRLPVVDINRAAILDRYAEIDAYSMGKHPTRALPPGQSARKMGKNDLWIAATASVSRATLVTIDKDFDHLANEFLTVIWIDQSWTEADA